MDSLFPRLWMDSLFKRGTEQVGTKYSSEAENRGTIPATQTAVPRKKDE